MLFAGLHALGRNAPLGAVQVDLGPFGFGDFAGSRQGPPHQLHAIVDLEGAAVVVEVVEQLADLPGGEGGLVLRLVGGQGLANGPDGVAVGTQRGYGVLEHGRHGSAGFSSHSRGAALDLVLQDAQHVGGCNGTDGHLADLAKHHAFQHVQAPVLGDVFPVFGLQPLARHLLEGDLGVAGLLDAVDLPLLGGVDALLDELARCFAPVSCLGQADGGVLAQGEHAGLALQREPVAPSLHAAGLDL